MATKLTYRFSIVTCSLLLLACASGGHAQSINSTWVCGTGNYSDTTCWDPLLSVPPCNSGPIIFDVNIPVDIGTVSMDVNICEVNSFILGEHTTFKVLADNSFSVADQADIYGIIHGNGGSFIAPIAAFPENKAQIIVEGGALVQIGAMTYSATGLSWSYTLMSSDGVGSLLNLSTMTELDDCFGAANHNGIHTIVAQNNGIIDLSSLTRIIGPTINECLNVNLNSGGSINLNNLTTISHAGSAGRVRFNLDGDVELELPSLSSASSTEFHVSTGATLIADNSRFFYSAAGLSESYTLMSSDGAGSILNLSAMTELDDSFSRSSYTRAHTIVAQNEGVIDLSGLTRIIGPANDERLDIEIDNGTIDMSSLQTITGSTGSISFDINNGGTLILGNVTAEKASSITLNDPNDLLIASKDLNLGTTISISNPGYGELALSGDFTYSHTDETKAPFGNSYVCFNGQGPQELEVGGYDIGEFVDFLANDNFGFGRMVIGESNEPTVVLLVDYIDNGNRNGFGGSAEVLYLFGKDGDDGLHIRKDSILYMGGLHVYAMLDGVMTDLTTLFEPNEVIIPFNEGCLCLDRPGVRDPRNLVKNGYFETGDNFPTADNPVVTLPAGAPDIDNWEIDKETINWIHESFAADSPFHIGKRYADLSSTETGKGAISQDTPTEPSNLYHVWFDMAANPLADAGTTLRVSAADSSEEFPATGAGWQTKTWRFVANEDTTTLTFEGIDEPNTPFSVHIDNVIVLPKDSNCLPSDDYDLIVQITNIENPDCSTIKFTVTVTDVNLMAVTGLDASNFSVFEDDELQTPINVELNRSPIAVCLVLDYSGSMSTNAVEAMEEAAKTFVQNMYDHDYGEILKFSVEIEVMQAFTDDKDALRDAIEQPPDFPRVSTSLYDAIYRAISDTAEQTGNKAVIAMSDGDDNKSENSESDVIEHATHNGVPVFTIGLGREIDVNDLRTIAEQTGGVYYESPTPDDLMAIYQALSLIFKNQYLVTYETTICEPNNTDDIEHELEIAVNLDMAYGQDSKSFSCPPACNPDIDSDDDIDEN